MPLKANEKDVYDFFSKAGKVSEMMLLLCYVLWNMDTCIWYFVFLVLTASVDSSCFMHSRLWHYIFSLCTATIYSLLIALLELVDHLLQHLS